MAFSTEKNSLGGWVGRMSIAALKIAVLYEVATTGELVVSPDSMTRACKLIDELKRDLTSLAKYELSGDDPLIQKATTVLRKVKTIKAGQLCKRAKIMARDWPNIKATLEDRDQIECQPEGRGITVKWIGDN